jgi:hypothetical protein
MVADAPDQFRRALDTAEENVTMPSGKGSPLVGSSSRSPTAIPPVVAGPPGAGTGPVPTAGSAAVVAVEPVNSAPAAALCRCPDRALARSVSRRWYDNRHSRRSAIPSTSPPSAQAATNASTNSHDGRDTPVSLSLIVDGANGRPRARIRAARSRTDGPPAACCNWRYSSANRCTGSLMWSARPLSAGCPTCTGNKDRWHRHTAARRCLNSVRTPSPDNITTPAPGGASTGVPDPT